MLNKDMEETSSTITIQGRKEVMVKYSKLKSVGHMSIYNNKFVERIEFPELVSVGRLQIYNCPNLKEIYFPKLKEADNIQIYKTKQLKWASFPSLTEVANGVQITTGSKTMEFGIDFYSKMVPGSLPGNLLTRP